MTNFTKFDFIVVDFDAIVYVNIKKINANENVHVLFFIEIKKKIDAISIQKYTYVFDVNNVKFFIAIVSIFEKMNVFVYLNIVTNVINKIYLIAIENILIIEFKHSFYIRAFIKQSFFFFKFFRCVIELQWNFLLIISFIIFCSQNNSFLSIKTFFIFIVLFDNSTKIIIDIEITFLIFNYIVIFVSDISQIYVAFITIIEFVFIS